MIETAVIAYLIGWFVGTAVVYVASRRLNDPSNPAPHLLILSAMAGALWPMLLLGAVEFSSLMACSSAASHLKTDEPELVGAGVVPLR